MSLNDTSSSASSGSDQRANAFQVAHRTHTWCLSRPIVSTGNVAETARRPARPGPSHTLVNGYRVLVDKSDVTADLASGLAGLDAAGHDPNVFDASSWVWFLGLKGWLEQGRCWQVYTNLVQLIDTRLVPLFYDGLSYELETRASAAQLQQLHDAVPRSVDRAELKRALQATLLAYEDASMAWSQRADADMLRSPLADSIRRAVLSQT